MNIVMTTSEMRHQTRSSTDAGTASLAFDYNQLRPDVAETLWQSAVRIRGKVQNLGQGIFAIGRELIKAKAALPRGLFGLWLEKEFCWNERTAQRYMRAAEVFGGESDIVSVFEAATIYELSARSTPPAIRNEVVARLQAGERLAPQAVRKLIKTARQGGTVTPALAISAPQSVEPKLDGVCVGGVCEHDWPNEDRQAGATTPARRAADLLLDHFDHDWDELAVFLEEADANQLRDHLLQRCSDRRA